MKIYTSYFARLSKIRKDENLFPISIARFLPKWIEAPVYEYKKLAPSKELLLDIKNGDISVEEYKQIYKEEVLDNLNPHALVTHLQNMAPFDKDVVLLCYERPGEFCHRSLVVQWFRENGIDCSELRF